MIKKLVCLMLISLVMLPNFAFAAGQVAKFTVESYGVRYQITGTEWSSYVLNQSSSGGYKNVSSFERVAYPQIHTIRCNGSATFRFVNNKGETVNTSSVTTSGISQESSICNPPTPKPDPTPGTEPKPTPIKPKPVPPPAPVKNTPIKVPPTPQPPSYDFDVDDEEPDYSWLFINTEKKAGSSPVIDFYDRGGRLIESKPMVDGGATYQPSNGEPFNNFVVRESAPSSPDENFEPIVYPITEWVYADEKDEQAYFNEVVVECTGNVPPMGVTVNLKYTDGGSGDFMLGYDYPTRTSYEITSDGKFPATSWATIKFTTPEGYRGVNAVSLTDINNGLCHVKSYESNKEKKEFSEQNPFKPGADGSDKFDYEVVKAGTTSPFISEVTNEPEEECDPCKIFECPAWGEYMGKLDEIKNTIPPPPNWDQVAEKFRDKIVPKLVNDMKDMLGEAPAAPTPPPQLPGLDDRGINDKKPQMQDVPGLKESGFDVDKIKSQAPEIQFREDPTGGFDLLQNPLDSLPSLPDALPIPGETNAGEWGENKPQEQDNPFPMPKDSGEPVIGAPPVPSDDGGGSAPIPGSDSGSAPIPSGEGGSSEMRDYKPSPSAADGSGKVINP